MARLDDARVHRADRDLMHAIALHAHEVVVIDDRFGGLAQHSRGINQWPKALRPGRVAQPRAGIRIGGAQLPTRSAMARCMRAARERDRSMPG